MQFDILEPPTHMAFKHSFIVMNGVQAVITLVAEPCFYYGKYFENYPRLCLLFI